MDSRNELQNILVKASRLLKERDSLLVSLEQVQKQYLPTEGGYKELWHGLKPFWRKFGIVISAGFVYEVLAQNVIRGIINLLVYVVGLPDDLIMILIQLLEFIVIALALIICQERANKKIRAKNQANADRLERNKQHNYQNYQREAELGRKLGQLQNIYDAECAPYIPPSYRYDTHAVTTFASYFINGRTDTLKEAVNLYETEEHRKRVEANQREQIREEKRANFLRGMQVAATWEQAAATNRAADASNRIANSIDNLSYKL